jgi:hypothetical protein
MREIENREILDRMATLEHKLTSVEKEVVEIKSNTKDLITTFESLTGFLRVIDFLYRISKPIVWFVMCCAAVYYFFIGIKMPIVKM